MTEHWQSAPPEPRPSVVTRLGIAATALVVVAALVVIGVNLVQPDDPIAQPRVTPSSAAPPPQPAPATQAWALPQREWEVLPAPNPTSPLAAAQDTPLNALVSVRLASCPHPTPITSEKQWRSDVQAQWSCLHRAFIPEFERLGWPTAEPAVEFFTGPGDDSVCGYLDAPAFYCADGDGTVHFGGEHFEMAKAWDLSINEMVNHEYGHHLQSLAGITTAKMAVGGREADRRAELQAVCWSGMLTMHNRSFTFNERDYRSWEDRLASMREDRIHGNRASLIYWGMRGLYAATLGDCNTWVVEPERVA